MEYIPGPNAASEMPNKALRIARDHQFTASASVDSQRIFFEIEWCSRTQRCNSSPTHYGDSHVFVGREHLPQQRHPLECLAGSEPNGSQTPEEAHNVGDIERPKNHLVPVTVQV